VQTAQDPRIERQHRGNLRIGLSLGDSERAFVAGGLTSRQKLIGHGFRAANCKAELTCKSSYLPEHGSRHAGDDHARRDILRKLPRPRRRWPAPRFRRRKRIVALLPIEAPAGHASRLRPSRLAVCECRRRSRARIRIVRKHHPVADEDPIFNNDALANE